jgi:myo-inositol-1(or 4)-monophosphatase
VTATHDDESDPALLRSVAEELASEAAAFVRRRRAEVFGAAAEAAGAVKTKSTPTDPVTVVDTETEQLLRRRLAERRPDDPILGEEGGGPAAGAGDAVTWVLDPIDGTVNFVYDIGAYAVSVGVQRGGVSVAGAVADVAAGPVYSAARGRGATMRVDGVVTALRCSAVTDLSLALVGTGFSYDPEQRRRQGAVVAEVLPQVRDLRRIGSSALDLCNVAAGRFDAYWEDGVHRWDWAAAALIAEEAGATVLLPDPATAAAGGPGLVVASAPGITAAFHGMLTQAGVPAG